jgi:hypothetical protein
MNKYGKIAGVPYDFRRPTLSRMKERIWNPEDPRIITPRTYGIGWAVNLPALRKKSKAGFYVAVLFYLVILVNMALSFRRSLRRLKSLLGRS